MNANRYVVVTTDKDKRGVFGGRLVDQAGDTVVLEDVRMTVYWSMDCHGVLGLAASGPNEYCRISPAAPRIELCGVTAVIDMSPAAHLAWAKEPWGKS